ncbi:MAG: response regulator [Bryobacteraceae bacterium]|nr:response regulator [Bryobacteraceae bacterium]
MAEAPSNGQDAKADGVFTILVADDDDAIRALTAGVLRIQGYNVLQAADGVEALKVAAQHSGPIHLLLTDVSMPRLDGWGLHRRMNGDRPGMTTLFMSGSLDQKQHQQAAFLPKPFTVSALIHKVTEALNFSAGSFASE